MTGREPDGDGLRLLVEPATTTRWVRVLYAVCVLLVVAGEGLRFFSHAFDHVHYGFEAWPGFYGAFGFVVFVFIVYCGRWLRGVVSRPESYYRVDEPERSK
ncbi:MAG: hypothetical protein MPN21_24895 [Thermoanaerobaculia bacterium]|nr:hypothetical protein [Thermoanaerobaculia bacterium]